MNADAPYKVLSSVSDDVATILLYGVIGQDFWWDKELDEESITHVAFAKKMIELESAGVKRVNIRINSPGGSMYHGNAIMSSIRRSKLEIHMYNDGLAASMAGDLFFAVPQSNRHMSANSLCMIHGALNGCVGNSQALRRAADILDKWTDTAAAAMAATSHMSKDEIMEKFYNDGEDHWITASEMLDMKLIDKVDDYELEDAPSPATTKLSFTEVIKSWAAKGDQAAKAMLDRFDQVLAGKTPQIAKAANQQINKSTNQPSTSAASAPLREINKENDMTPEEVQAMIDANNVAIEKKHQDALDAQKSEFNKTIAEKVSEIDALKADVAAKDEQLATTPAAAAAKADTAPEEYEGMTEEQIREVKELDKFADVFEKAAADDDYVSFS